MAEENKENKELRSRTKKIDPIQPIFRRREDEIKFDTIEKILSSIKYLIGLIAIILYFFYQIIISQNTTDAYQIKLLNEAIEKINKQEALLENRFSNGFTKKALPGTCIGCHVPQRFDVVIPKDWKFDTFRDYVRGTTRVPANGVMPSFDKNILSDAQLEEIFVNLKQ